MHHTYVDLILGKQDGLNLSADFNQIEPPSQGLYLLGTLPEDGVIQSTSAFGETPQECNANGQLKFLIVRTDDDGSLRVINTYDLNQKNNETIPIKLLKFNNEKHPHKNDLIVMYILSNPLRNWCPLQVNLDTYNGQGSRYRFLEGSNEVEGKNINNELKKFIGDHNRDSWKDVRSNLEFNVQVKIKCKDTVMIG